jgi:hypothetical protein
MERRDPNAVSYSRTDNSAFEYQDVRTSLEIPCKAIPTGEPLSRFCSSDGGEETI